MKTVQLVKLRSGQGKQATVTFEIIGDDFLEHILLSASPIGTVFEMSYQIVEAGTQKSDLHGRGLGYTPYRSSEEILANSNSVHDGWNTLNPYQEGNPATSNMPTHTSTSNEKDSPTPERPKGGKWAKWAGILCNDKEFQEWLEVESVEEARTYILNFCQITSRAEIDHDKKTMEDFRSIMRDFDMWKKRSDKDKISYKNQCHVDDMPKYSGVAPRGLNDLP